MKAIRIHEHGGVEVLKVEEIPKPQPGLGEVLVRVTHVGLNHLDVWVRRGVPGHKFPLPLTIGSDVVGIREDTGEKVALMPGFGCNQCAACERGEHSLCKDYKIRGEGTDGGCCEWVSVPEWQLLPCSLPLEEAAALPLSLLTAWHMLIGRAQVKSGDFVVVQGGAGGVGSLAIQVARHAGARVLATASTPEKRDLCTALGAELVCDYAALREAAKEWTAGQGVDVVVEHVGEATWKDSVSILRWGGTLVTCGATTGYDVKLNLRVLFFKQLSLLGSTMGGQDEMREAWEAVNAGSIRPVVHCVWPITKVGEAHELLEKRGVQGKIVLRLTEN